MAYADPNIWARCRSYSVLWRFYTMIKELVNADTMKKQALNASQGLGVCIASECSFATTTSGAT